MPSKTRIIISGLIVTIIAIIIYIVFRIDIIEKEYIKTIKNKSADINKIYRKFNEKYPDPGINKKKLKEFFELINKKHPDIALIAVADMNYSLYLLSKNNRLISSEKTYNSIIDDFVNRKLSVPSGKLYITRYYSLNSKNNDSQKFYIINRIINNSRILYLFPYKPGKKTVTKVILEISVIIIIIIIITTIVFIKSNQVHSRSEEEKKFNEDNDFTGSDNRKVRNISLQEKSIKESSDDKILSNEFRSASDSLNRQIYRLFNDLNSKYFPESISLYMKITENLLSKTFEFKGKSFIKIESASFDTIDIDNDAGREFLKSTVMILEKGKKFIFPIIYENSLLGVISIVRNTGFKGKEIQDIKNDLIVISEQLSEYIVITRVMLDSDTGLYSKTYFDLKYNQELDSAAKNSEDLSIILIRPFKDDLKIDTTQYSSIIKLISSALSNIIKNNHFISRYEDCLAVIIPGLKSNYCYEIAENILNSLSKIRIKIDDNNHILLNPYIGISSTDNVPAGDDLFETAQMNLNSSMKHETGNIIS